MGQYGSGEGAQPFKTAADYDNWLKRASHFNIWADSAILYFRKGMASGYVLPKSLVLKMIPEMEAMVTIDPEKNLFYGPVRRLPSGFDSVLSSKLKNQYVALINEQIVPAYKKLGDFLKEGIFAKGKVKFRNQCPARQCNALQLFGQATDDYK